MLFNENVCIGIIKAIFRNSRGLCSVVTNKQRACCCCCCDGESQWSSNASIIPVWIWYTSCINSRTWQRFVRERVAADAWLTHCDGFNYTLDRSIRNKPSAGSRSVCVLSCSWRVRGSLYASLPLRGCHRRHDDAQRDFYSGANTSPWRVSGLSLTVHSVRCVSIVVANPSYW